MIKGEELMHMFIDVHGEAPCSCSWEIVVDVDTLELAGVACMKNGHVCWEESKVDILLDYLEIIGEPDAKL